MRTKNAAENEKIRVEIEKLTQESKASRSFFAQNLPLLQILGALATACVTLLILYFTHFFDGQAKIQEANKIALDFEIKRLNIQQAEKQADLNKATLAVSAIRLEYYSVKRAYDSLDGRYKNIVLKYSSANRQVTGLSVQNNQLLAIFRNDDKIQFKKVQEGANTTPFMTILMWN